MLTFVESARQMCWLRFSVIMIKMFEQNNISPYVRDFALKLTSDTGFRDYYQDHSHKSLFKNHKYSYEEMLQLLRKMAGKTSVQVKASIEDLLKSGVKIWAYFQYKVFSWICLWVIYDQHLSQMQVFDADISVLSNIFPDKDERFIRYELFLIFSKMESYECRWNVAEDLAFKQKVSQQGDLSKAEINWRFLSFQMLLERTCFKSPNELRERWVNHLNPSIRKDKWLPEEDTKLLRFYQECGPKWSVIAKLMRNRNEHMVKNRFLSLKRRWKKDANNQKKPFSLKTLIRDLNNQVPKSNTKKAQLRPDNKVSLSIEPIIEEIKSQPQIIEILVPSVSQEKLVSHSLKMISVQQKLSLSLIDVQEGYFDANQQVQQQNEARYAKDQLSQYLEATELFNDPLLKLNDRVETNDYQWLDNMIEQKNMSWLSDDQ